MTDLDLQLKVRALVEGINQVKVLSDQVQALNRSAGRPLRDPTAQLHAGAVRARGSIGLLNKSIFTLKNTIGTVGVLFAGRELVRAADAYTLLRARIDLVTKSAEELAAVERRLFDSAQRTRSGYQETVALYARVARNAKGLGASQAELLQLTETVNQALQVGGATTQEAAAGTIQFAQALASGTLRGDELRSVLENMPRLAQAIVEGLEQIGVGTNLTLGDLRRMSEQGELSAERLFAALLTQGQALTREFGRIPRTVGGALTQLGNDAQRALAKIDMDPLLAGIDGVRELLTDPGMLEGIKTFGELLVNAFTVPLIPARELAGLMRWFRGQRDTAMSLQDIAATGDPARLQARIANLRRTIDDLQALRGAAGPTPAEQARIDALRQEIMTLERLRQLHARRITGEAPDLTIKPPPGPDKGGASADTAAVAAAKKRADAIAAIIDALREQAATEGQTAEQVALYRLAQMGASEATLAQARTLIETIDVRRQEIAAMDASAKAAEQRAEALRKAQEADRAVLESLAEELRLITLGARERVQEEAVRRLSAEATDEQRRAVEALAGALYDQQEATKQAVSQMSEFAIQGARNMQSAFADFLFDPFSQGLQGMLSGFVSVIHRMASEALAAKLGEALFGSLLTAGGGAAGGGGGTGLIGSLLAGLFHTGGVAGNASAYRRMPAVMMATAPRYHGGGLAGLKPDEVPAVLRIGEEVLMPNDPRHRNNGGGIVSAPPQVNVRNINLFDTQMIGDYLSTPPGERAILNVVSRNKSALGIA